MTRFKVGNKVIVNRANESKFIGIIGEIEKIKQDKKDKRYNICTIKTHNSIQERMNLFEYKLDLYKEENEI